MTDRSRSYSTQTGCKKWQEVRRFRYNLADMCYNKMDRSVRLYIDRYDEDSRTFLAA